MNEQDLEDLATIAACHHRLVLRARSNGAVEAAATFVSISADSMPLLCRAAGVSDFAVMERASAILTACFSGPRGAVH